MCLVLIALAAHRRYRNTHGHTNVHMHAFFAHNMHTHTLHEHTHTPCMMQSYKRVLTISYGICKRYQVLCHDFKDVSFESNSTSCSINVDNPNLISLRFSAIEQQQSSWATSPDFHLWILSRISI